METFRPIAVIRASIHSDEIWRGFPARRSFERVKMKIRMIALAGVTALALSTPAMAAEGWYLGLGGGWDHQNGIRGTSSVAPTVTGVAKSEDGAIIAGTFGYAWDNGLRLEAEDAYTSHDFSNPIGGSSSITSFM